MEGVKNRGFIFPLSNADFQKSALGVFTVLYPQDDSPPLERLVQEMASIALHETSCPLTEQVALNSLAFKHHCGRPKAN